MSRKPSAAWSILYDALLDGDADTVLAHLDKGADEFLAERMCTVLEAAVSETPSAHRLALVLHLLDAGVDPSATVDAILPQAAATGDVDLVEHLILAGAENEPSESLGHALEPAAEEGDLAMLSLLLENFGPVALADAAWSAAVADEPEAFDLLESWADEETDLAAARQRLQLSRRVRQLKEGLVKPKDVLDAVEAGDASTLRRLLAGGASANAFESDWHGNPVSALSHAARRNDPRCINILLRGGAAVDGIGDADGPLESRPPVFQAVYFGALAAAERLLAAGPDLSPVPQGAEGTISPLFTLLIDGIGGQPIDMTAAQKIVHGLVAGGCELDVQDAQGRTPLMWAAIRPAPKIIQTLLKLGADPSITDHDGNPVTSILLARSLLSSDPARHRAYHAALEQIGGRPPYRREAELYAAAFHGDLKRCRKLLAQGADPAHRFEGHNSLDIARLNRRLDIQDLLQEHVRSH